MGNRNGYSILLNAVRNIAAWRPPFGSSNHPLDIDKVLRADIVDIISIAQNALVNHENCTTTETVAERDHLRAVNAELLEALEPFAKFACDTPHVNEPDCYNCRARTAITRARG